MKRIGVFLLYLVPLLPLALAAGASAQPDAGALFHSAYTLLGGFWGGATTPYRVYMPLVPQNFR